MNGRHANPPGSTPPIPPYWVGENDWLVLLVVLPRDDAEDREIGAEAIGYMFAYAQMTDTRMVALLGDPDADMHELLFSFSSQKNKKEFLRLLKSSEATNCGDEEIMIPHPNEIAAAQPIARVLPEGVMQRVTVIATMLLGGSLQ